MSTPLTREDWAARYLDEHGNLRPVPNDGAVPGTRVRFDSVEKLAESFSSEVTRLGSPEGEFFTILGGDFDQRASLPDASTDRLHTYVFTGTLPTGWTIEVGRTAPAFGRSGGALYLVVVGRNGQRLNAFELVELGVLRGADA